MHTAICTFEDRALAEQAVQRLERAGYGRHDIHLEHRHADGRPMDDPHSGRDVVGKLSFFERLFGAGKHAPHADTYASAVDRGLYVVLVESPDEDRAARAQDVLHGLNPDDVNVFHRADGQPLRELVAERQAGSLERAFGTARADMGAPHDATDQREVLFPPERAMASQGWGEQRTLDLVEPAPRRSADAQDAIGPRGADSDKPNR